MTELRGLKSPDRLIDVSYSYSNWGELKDRVAVQLSDPSFVYWTAAEVSLYLNSALREFNSIARVFRDRGQFPTVANQPFYDLRDVLRNGASELLLDPVITDDELLVQAKYMLMEPSPNDQTSFTDGFDLTNFTNAFNERRNQFCLETGLVISQPTAQVISSGTGRVSLADDSIIDVRRATWTDLDGNVTQLQREDQFTSFAFSPDWPQTLGTPQRYSVYPDPLLTLQLIPPPIDNGTLTLQTISSGELLDDFTPFLLWGVLSDVLSSPGPGCDPLRGDYAEARYKEGIIVGRQVATVLQSFLNDVPVSTESVFNFDTFQPSWQVAGTPASVGLLGSNLVAVAPVADDIYSVVMDVVRNAPQFTDNASPVPLGREYLDIIVDYACHLAAFKQGGQEFQSTYDAYDAFVKAALSYNNRMSSQNLNFETLVDRAKEQEKELSLRKEEQAA